MPFSLCIGRGVMFGLSIKWKPLFNCWVQGESRWNQYNMNTLKSWRNKPSPLIIMMMIGFYSIIRIVRIEFCTCVAIHCTPRTYLLFNPPDRANLGFIIGNQTFYGSEMSFSIRFWFLFTSVADRWSQRCNQHDPNPLPLARDRCDSLLEVWWSKQRFSHNLELYRNPQSKHAAIKRKKGYQCTSAIMLIPTHFSRSTTELCCCIEWSLIPIWKQIGS